MSTAGEEAARKSTSKQSTFQTFQAPSGFKLQSGEILDDQAFLAYATYGTLNAARSNAILWPTCYGQRHFTQKHMIGPGKRFDPNTHFIITVNMLGNGVSYSPTTQSSVSKPYPAAVTYLDNAILQELLLRSLGVDRLALIYGFSMGAMLALEWAVHFPERVATVVAVCGSARTGPANAFFLRYLQAALRSDPACELDENDRVTGFRVPPLAGLRAFSLTYADWIFDGPAPSGPSPSEARPAYARAKPGARFYADQLYKEVMPVERCEDFLEAWVNNFSSNWQAIEYYVVSETWLRGDVSANPSFNGDLAAALGSIRAMVYLMPSTTDQYFVAEEIEEEARMIPNCIFQPLPSSFGHIAEGRPECQPLIQEAIEKCLAHSKL